MQRSGGGRCETGDEMRGHILRLYPFEYTIGMKQLVLSWRHETASLLRRIARRPRLPRILRRPAAASAAPASKPAPATQVQVVTSMGSFTIELNAERAPLTVAQFLKFVDQGFYSGTIFHRAIPNFVIQGGGYDVDYKLKGNPPKVVNESGNGLTNSARHRGPRPPARAPRRRRSVLRESGRQCRARSECRPAGAMRCSAKSCRAWTWSTRSALVPTGAKGPFKENAPLKPVIIQKIERVPPPRVAAV